MTEKKKVPDSWKQSDKSIRAVQVIFELEQAQSRALRMQAIQHDMSPSDYIRDIIGLPRKKPVRPRLSISLSKKDYELLGERYNLKPDDRDAIREAIKKELIQTTSS